MYEKEESGILQILYNDRNAQPKLIIKIIRENMIDMRFHYRQICRLITNIN